MIVKRIGNDVYLTWEINNNDGSPVDFSDIIDMKVYIRRAFFKQLHEQKFEVTGNVIKLHYIAEEQAGIGSYDLLAKWTKADQQVEGGIASFAVDYKNAFKLIGFGETVPDQQDETFSSTIYEAIKGDTGNGILSIEHTSTEGLVKTYTVMFTDSTSTTFQIADGHSPVISFTGTTILIDGVPQVDLKGDKGDSFTYADFTPEQIAELKQPATDAAQQADTAITAAITAAGTANTAADNADNARLAIQSDLALKAAHGYVSPEIPKTLKDIEQKVDAGNLIIEYTHTGNKKVIVEGIDYDTNSFISTNHGLVDGDIIGVVLPQFQASSNPYQNNFPIGTPPDFTALVFGYFVVNSSTDKFSISQKNAGAQITLASVTNFDFNSLWFERQTNRLSLEVLNPRICHRYVIYIEGFIMRPPRYIYIAGDNNPSNLNVFGLYSCPHRTTNAIQYGFGVAPNDHYLGLCNYGVIEIVNGETGMMQKQYYNKTAINGTTHIPINFMLNTFEKIGNVTKLTIAEMFISNGTKIRLYGE